MKAFNYLLFFFLVFSVSSCNDDNNEGDKNKGINLNSYDLVLWAGQDTLIAILDNSPSYTITTDKKEVAFGEVVNDKIHIKTNDVGNAILRLTDSNGRTADIKVNSKTIKGGWKVIQSAELVFKVLVESDDEIFSSRLHDEILLKVRKNVGTVYGFMEKGSKMTVKYKDKDLIEGEFSYQSLQLVMKYNSEEKKYTINPFSNNFVQVIKDQTLQYQTRYPIKGISKVQIFEYWVMITIG